MSADIRRLFPEGLKNIECERGKPRHSPPLRFAPTKLLDHEDGDDDKKKNTITVELNGKITMKLVPYSFVDIESFLRYQQQHDYVLSQQDAKANWTKIHSLFEAAVTSRDTISPNTIDGAEKKARKKFQEQVDQLGKRKDAIVSKAFTLYQQMSASALRAEWDDIVQEFCFTPNWTRADGTVCVEERGQDWTTLAECKRAHLLTVADQDASERATNYNNVTVRKPDRLPFKYFHKRIKELDDLQKLLPCLKDQPDCPPEVERTNVLMTPFAMCTLLMQHVSPRMEDEYNCLCDTVPTDPKKLVAQLTKIETKLRTISNENSKSHDRLKGGRPDDPQRVSRSGAKRSNATGSGREPDKPIPRKTPRTADREQCKLCAEYGGQSKTHSTTQCRKWIAGGKPHSEWRGGKSKAANINVHQGDTGVNQLMAQQAEFQKKIMKQMKSFEKKKKKKSRRRDRSDSDSSVSS